jgi:hypothetical protein
LLLGYPRPSSDPFDPLRALRFRLYRYRTARHKAQLFSTRRRRRRQRVARASRRVRALANRTALRPTLSLSPLVTLSVSLGIHDHVVWSWRQASKLASSSRNSFTSTMLRHAQTCSDLRHSRVAGGCAGFAYPSRLFLGSSHMPRPYLAPRLPAATVPHTHHTSIQKQCILQARLAYF